MTLIDGISQDSASGLDRIYAGQGYAVDQTIGRPKIHESSPAPSWAQGDRAPINMSSFSAVPAKLRDQRPDRTSSTAPGWPSARAVSSRVSRRTVELFTARRGLDGL